MKNKIFYLIISSMILFTISCEEDDTRGQFPVDSVPPGVVTNVSVENGKGMSTLTYTNPTDTDLLYVEAKYINSLGNEAIVRSSAFTNTLELGGFLKTTKVLVSLTAVDKSYNESESIQIEIEPLDSPMFDVLASMEYKPIFGGVGLSWVNEAQQEIVVELLREENGVYRNYESFYSDGAPTLEVKARGLPSVETNFAVFVRDEFRQSTNILEFTITPFFEEEIPVDGIRKLADNPEFSFPFSNGFNTILDGVTPSGSYSIQDATNTVDADGDGDGDPYFTMDMGVEIKFSRFKMWSRADFVYDHSQPRHILLLGTNDQALANDPSDRQSEWAVVGEWVDQKQSGGGPGDPETEDDLAYFNSGMDFDIPIESGSYRYLRFRTLASWVTPNRMWMSELKFWGEIQN